MKPSLSNLFCLAKLAGRRDFLAWMAAGFALAGMGLLPGCKALNTRSQSPDKPDNEKSDEPSVKLVGDVADPVGLNWVRVETIGLVTNLPGTGSNPPDGPERSMLLDEMRKRGVQNPNQLLASPSTELVVVQGFLRPGIQEGDRFDIELRTLSRSDGTSLAGGFFMESRLKQMAVGMGRIGDAVAHEGRPLARAKGPVMVAPGAKSKVDLTRGRVLGGAVATESRDLGLVISKKNYQIAKRIGAAVNRRFNMFRGGVKTEVAVPKSNEFVLLKVHPRYKDNIERYIKVVRALPISENVTQHQARLQLLERQLFEPIASASAALKLEALGKESIPVLKKGLHAPQLEVRFYAAEALAYLDESDAAAPLAKAAREEPAFRAYALAALSAMDDYAAREALRELLSSPSAETRYGAFRALWAMPTRDPLVQGEDLNGQLSLNVLPIDGPPMIHVTRSFRPEIVAFGTDLEFSSPMSLQAGSIMVNCQQGNRVTVSRFEANQPDKKRTVSTRVEDVIRAIVELGGTYPDVVQAIQQAKSTGALSCRFEVEALPQGGRAFNRDGQKAPAATSAGQALPGEPREKTGDADEGDEKPTVIPASPAPGLFASQQGRSWFKDREAGRDDSREGGLAPDDEEGDEPEKTEKPGPFRSFFAKLKKKKQD